MSDRPMYYDRQGRAMSLMEWATRFGSGTDRRVALDVVCEGVEVSTIWLGLDHNFFGGPPLIFETMVFVTLDEPRVTRFGTLTREGGETYRWSTEAQALAGHDRIVAELRAQLGPKPEAPWLRAVGPDDAVPPARSSTPEP